MFMSMNNMYHCSNFIIITISKYVFSLFNKNKKKNTFLFQLSQSFNLFIYLKNKNKSLSLLNILSL